MNPTVKQHFVPRFYLKNFADPQRMLHTYNLIDKRIEQPKHYSAVGYERYFYAKETGAPDEISQRIEEWLGVYEDILAKHLPAIIKRILGMEQITDDDKYIMSALMCMLWLRSPKMRKQMSAMRGDLSEQLKKFYTSQQVENLGLKFNNVQHLKFMTETFGYQDKGFTNMFFGHKWKIYIAKGNEKFITTDSPVVEWWLPPEGFYGATFLDRSKYFALTPEIFIELSYPTNSKKINRKTLFENMDDTVKIYNILLAANCSQYAYSGNKGTLEDLMRGRDNHRAVDEEYIKKYVIPWKEYKRKRENN